MTPEEFVEHVKKGPVNRMLSAVAPLSEDDRKPLSKAVGNLRAEFAKNTKDYQASLKQTIICPKCGKPLRSGRSQKCFECGSDYDNPSRANLFHAGDRSAEQRLKLAILAVGRWVEAQRVHIADINPRDLIFQVLSDRKPDWLPRWVEQECRTQFFDWHLIRRFVRAGLCPQPQTDRYIQDMMFAVYRRDRPLKELLLEDANLLANEVWRIFELAPVRGTIIVVQDLQDPKGWANTLVELSQGGNLDRGRLLAASLDALKRNREARNTGWFQKFHELLGPIVEERRTLQASYVQLLNHPVPSVAGMALSALAVLEKEKVLDVAAFLDGVGPVFQLSPKVQPLALIKLLTRMAKSRDWSPKIAEVLLSGLNHPAPQVQEAILHVLHKIRDHAGEVIAASLPALVEELAPSLQEQARKLLPQQRVDLPAALPHQAAPPVPDLIHQARNVPSPWREAAGIDSLLRAIAGHGELSAVHFDPMSVPRLHSDDRVQPIQSLDELIERLTVAVEGLDDPIEFELLLDGISRFGVEVPTDFQARTAALLQRVRKLSPAGLLTMTAFGLRAFLFRLILHWCGQESRDTLEGRDTITAFLGERVDLILLHLKKKQAVPLIACPDYRQGWIAAQAMFARFSWYQDHNIEPSTADLLQGLLRLAPDGRTETLIKSASLQGKFAPAFRYALGGPLEDPSLPSAVLIAAGRARSPFARLDDLHGAPDATGPDAVEPARYAWETEPIASDAKTPRLNLVIEPAFQKSENKRTSPTVLLHTWEVIQSGVNRWVGTVWPANLDPFFAAGIRLRSRDFPENYYHRQRGDEIMPLFDPSVPFTEMAQVLLAIALGEQATEVTGLAVDALIELIRDGRCIGDELGRVFARMFPHNLIKLNRLGKHLETVAQASLLHAHVCAAIVQGSCKNLADLSKDLHHLLGPLLEWLSALEQGVHTELRPLLEKATSGKTGTLAKKLLKLSGTPNKREPVFLEALKGRIQRAERWANPG